MSNPGFTFETVRHREFTFTQSNLLRVIFSSLFTKPNRYLWNQSRTLFIPYPNVMPFKPPRGPGTTALAHLALSARPLVSSRKGEEGSRECIPRQKRRLGPQSESQLFRLCLRAWHGTSYYIILEKVTDSDLSYQSEEFVSVKWGFHASVFKCLSSVSVRQVREQEVGFEALFKDSSRDFQQSGFVCQGFYAL